MANQQVKLFKLDEFDWWAGETLADCIAAARRMDPDAYPQAETEGLEVPSDELQRLTFTDDSTGERRPFADELQRRVDDANEYFPQFFASENW